MVEERQENETAALNKVVEPSSNGIFKLMHQQLSLAGILWSSISKTSFNSWFVLHFYSSYWTFEQTVGECFLKRDFERQRPVK